MTLQEIADDVMDRLNLTSDAAETRVKDGINDLYKELTMSLGLVTTRRVVEDFDLDPGDATLEDQHPELEVTGMEKVLRVRRLSGTKLTLLPELTYDELTNVSVRDGVPRYWAVYKQNKDSVTIVFDALPASTETFRIEGIDNYITLGDSDEPALPESFHSLLTQGVVAEELLKMEKPQLAAIASQSYERTLSNLKLFLATSGYLDRYQGKNSHGWRHQWRYRTEGWY